MDGFLSLIARMANNAIEREVSNESSRTGYRWQRTSSSCTVSTGRDAPYCDVVEPMSYGYHCSFFSGPEQRGASSLATQRVIRQIISRDLLTQSPDHRERAAPIAALRLCFFVF